MPSGHAISVSVSISSLLPAGPGQAKAEQKDKVSPEHGAETGPVQILCENVNTAKPPET